ncbi:SMP-30/gluconolactonase/LRE family protein [Halomonas sp. V046]|uniref:SMP-30/gluconolactonase/LRE family protein n=1 Tax=Halomonas sp. V046 TaxID=3459611 RepID=UPI0040446D2E
MSDTPSAAPSSTPTTAPSPCLGHAEVLVEKRCELGEGPSWDGARGEFRWLNILGRELHRYHLALREHRVTALPVLTSFAAPLASGDDLLVTEHGLARLIGHQDDEAKLAPWRDVEADNAITRSNDARLDRQGGLWFSTMGKAAEPGAGSLYRLYRGQIHVLRRHISIPNALCFSPDGRLAYFTDTVTGVVMRWPLDPDGFPLRRDGAAFVTGATQDQTEPPALIEPEPWADFSADAGNPDGAVVDSLGYMWLALWGAGRVARLDPEGREVGHVRVDAEQPSCPAFGGRDLTTLLITTATEGKTTLAEGAHDGATFIIDLAAALPGVRGLEEAPLKLN